jgi:hypothetical protein
MQGDALFRLANFDGAWGGLFGMCRRRTLTGLLSHGRCALRGCQGRVQGGLEQLPPDGCPAHQPGLELSAELHQFVDFGHDALLFGQLPFVHGF